MKNATLQGRMDAGNPHITPSQCYGSTGRFDEGEVAQAATPRRGSLLYTKFSWRRRIALVVGIVLAAFGVQAATYTTYTWQAVGDSYNGSFADSAHWTPAQTGYPGQSDGVIVNANQLAVFPRVDDDYTVTLPAGVVTNVATPQFYAQAGKTLTIDGSQTTWVIPTLADNTMTYGDLCFYTGNRDAGGNPANGKHFFSRFTGKDTPTALGTFKNFQVELASQTASIDGTRLTFTGDLDWTGGAILMHHGAAAGSKAEVVFANGSMKTMPALCFGFSNATNILTFDSFDGGLCKESILCQIWQGWEGPWLDNGLPGLFEFNLLNGSTFTGSTFTASASLSLGYSYSTYTSDSKTFRLNVKGGSHLSLSQLNMNNRGHYELNVVGAGSKCEIIYPTMDNQFSTSACSTSRVVVADGAYFRCADSLYLGGETAEKAATTYAEAIFSNATVEIRRNMRLGHGKLTLVGGTKLTFYEWQSDCLFHSAGVEGYPSELYVDDATVSFTQTGQLTMLQDFTAAKVGKKGLTLSADTAAAKNYTIPQNFSDWTSGGTVRARGGVNSAIILSGADSRESNLVVDRGTVYLASGANHNSHLTVTNGALFSLVGAANATGMTLKGLTLGDATTGGTLALDLDDLVTLSGPFDIANGSITYSSTLGDGEHTVFRMTTEPSAELVAFWEFGARGSFASGLDAAKYNIFSVAESGGVWNFMITVYSSCAAKAGDAVWNGSGDDWATAANWQGGQKPDGTHGALFNGAAPTSISVVGDVTTAGLTFDSASGYALSGATIKLAFNEGSAIGVSNGAHTVANDLVDPYSILPVVVEDGASLTMSGAIKGTGITKSGEGELAVEAPAMTLADGLVLKDGSTTFGEEATYNAALGLAPDTASKLVVVRADDDVTMSLGSVSGGSLVKWGSGRLTLNVDRDMTLAFGTDRGNLVPSNDYDLSDYSDTAAKPHGPIGVAEGELVIRGTSATRPAITVPPPSGERHSHIGLRTVSGSCANPKEPGLVIDHASVTFTSGEMQIGFGLAANKSFARAPYLVVTNGSHLSVRNFNVSEGQPAGAGALVFFESSSLSVNGNYANNSGASVTNVYTFVNGSTMFNASPTYLAGSVDYSFNRSGWYGLNSNSVQAVMLGNPGNNPLIRYAFRNGSRFNSSGFSAYGDTVTKPITVIFDDSEWFAGGGDRTIPTTLCNVTTKLEGSGLVVNPVAGATWTFNQPMVGEGGFTKKGEGTFVFDVNTFGGTPREDAATLCYSGMTDVQDGTLVVSENAISNFVGRTFRVAGVLDMSGQTLADAVVATAGGTIRNAALSEPRFVVGFDGEGEALPVVLDYANGFTMSGRVVFDFGAETGAPYAKGTVMTVARWTGAQKPDISRWRAVNVGEGLKCLFDAKDDGTITARIVSSSGFVLFVR